MYILGIQRDFIALHYLIGGDWGIENNLHAHHYTVEIHLEGTRLNEHGYLVDIVALQAHVDELIALYRDHTLNDLTDFRGLNPSLEHFARIFCQAFLARMLADNLQAIQVNLWEDKTAWTGYRQKL
jgi:6-pyruvoyltetrahydropterin/6-carboxytetrahydropterin synthase